MTKQGVRFDHFVAEVVEVIAATFPLHTLQRSQLSSPTSVLPIQHIDLNLIKSTPPKPC